jgi:rhamnogalacturonyl hydrolase YesR
LALLAQTASGQNYFKDWPEGSDPKTVGRKLTELFIQSPHGVYGYGAVPHIPYFEVCTWYGALNYAGLIKDKNLVEKLEDRFKPLLDKDSSLLPVPDHVDYSVFGALAIELFRQTNNEVYFALGKKYADKQWGTPVGPRVTAQSLEYYKKGYTWQTRLWIDDMYMISMLQVQAYRATQDPVYLDRAAGEMVFYLDQLQKPNGLFYHASDAPFFWGRGNGWMAAGMSELLRVLPAKHQHHERILRGYKNMMSTLLMYQAEDDGMWRQLIDDYQSWKETSSTAMFTYAMITGVTNGWLEKKFYGPAARKAWITLVSYINDKGEVTEVCEGTGAGKERQYYLDRKRITGDMHGQAPVLWCVNALLREKDKQ